MGLRKFFKKVGKAVGKVFKVVTAPIKWVGDATKWLGDKIGGDVGKIIGGLGSGVRGIGTYIQNTAENITDGIFTGHLDKAFKSVLDFTLNAVLVVGAVLSANPYAILGALAYVDSRFGDGNLLVNPFVNVSTGFLADTGILKNAREYREEIALVVGIGAGILAGYGASAFIGSLGLSQSIMNTYNAINAVNMAYGGYVSYKNYEELKERLGEQLEEYKKYLQGLEEEKKQANDLFLNQALNFSLYEWFAGGKKYNEFSVGNSEYDYLNTKNPWFVALNESEEKAKNYEDLKSYLSYKSLNVYDDFFEKTLKIDNVFGIASIKQLSNKDMYMNVASEYNRLVDYYYASPSFDYYKAKVDGNKFTKLIKAGNLKAIEDKKRLDLIELKEKELKYYERYL